MAEQKVKGDLIIGYSKYIRKKWGQDGVGECAAATGVDFSKLSEGQWYSHEMSSSVLNWIADNKGEEHVMYCGQFTVQNLGLMAYIVRFMDVKRILKRAPENYRDAFNYGSMEVDIHENSATIKLDCSALTNPVSCLSWVGVFRGVLELTKTVGVVEEVECQRDGAPYCVIEMHWE